jgi:hypothetical protein
VERFKRGRTSDVGRSGLPSTVIFVDIRSRSISVSGKTQQSALMKSMDRCTKCIAKHDNHVKCLCDYFVQNIIKLSRNVLLIFEENLCVG